MSTIQQSKRRLIGVVLLAWLAVIGFDFFWHGGLLAGLYAKPSPFLRSSQEAFQLIPLGYSALLIFAVFLIWLMLRLGINSWRSGLMFGLQVGALVGSTWTLGLLSIARVEVGLMTAWFIGQTIEAGIAGLILGAGLATKRPGRLTIYVISFVIVTIIITILLQSVR